LSPGVAQTKAGVEEEERCLLLLLEKEKPVARRAVARGGRRHGGHGGISPNSLLSAPPLAAPQLIWATAPRFYHFLSLGRVGPELLLQQATT